MLVFAFPAIISHSVEARILEQQLNYEQQSVNEMVETHLSDSSTPCTLKLVQPNILI